MFKVTNLGRAQRLLDYYNRVQGNHWILIGGTTAWDNETLPPTPSANSTQITEPIKFLRVSNYKAAYLNNSGDIISPAGTFQSITDFNLLTLSELNAFYLIVNAIVPQSELTGLTYRSVGLCNNLSSNPFNVNSIPYSNTINYSLEGVTYLTPQSSVSLTNSTYRFILEF